MNFGKGPQPFTLPKFGGASYDVVSAGFTNKSRAIGDKAESKASSALSSSSYHAGQGQKASDYKTPHAPKQPKDLHGFEGSSYAKKQEHNRGYRYS